MSETQPGADELRIRSILRKRGVGPDADWWAPNPDAPIIEDTTEPDDEPDQNEEETPERGPVFTPAGDYWPRPHLPHVLVEAPERAAAALSPKTRSLLYNASAAGAGWALGLYHQFAWALNDCGTSTGISGALVLGIGGSLLIAHVWDRRTRHWWPGIAWAARIPLATAMLALALYAPASV